MDISVKKLFVSFGETNVLSGVDLYVPDGEVCSLLGASGCGKSTLLRSVASIIKPLSGEVLLGGSPTDSKKQKIAFVPQNYGLLPWKRVYDNLLLGIRLRGETVDEDMLNDIILRMRIDNLMKRFPNELSGGQQQRVALARAFLQKPDVLLMDEPFAALDTFTSEQCRMLFVEIWNKYKVTTLFVTHSVDEAVELGTITAVMCGNPADRIEVCHTPVKQSVLREVMKGAYND